MKIQLGVFSEKLQAVNSRPIKEAPTWIIQVEGHFFQEEDSVWCRGCCRWGKCDHTFRIKEVELCLKQTVSQSAGVPCVYRFLRLSALSAQVHIKVSLLYLIQDVSFILYVQSFILKNTIKLNYYLSILTWGIYLQTLVNVILTKQL